MEGSSTHLRCSVHIDLCALERNLGKLRHFLPSSKGYIALVSADAFGYGVEAAVVRLMLSGADAFAVTNTIEGVRVREVGYGWPVIILSSTLPSEEDIYFENNLTPVIVSLEEALRFEACAAKLDKTLNVHMRLPIDGLASLPSADEAKELFDFLRNTKYLNLQAFCLAGTGSGAPQEGYSPNSDFLKYAEGALKNSNSHIFIHHSDVCDTSAFPQSMDKTLRAGLVLFGVKPSENSMLKGFEPEHVLTFRTSVSQIKKLPKGATVGYSRTYRLEKDSKVALISVGYGDGLAREAGGKCEVLIRGKRAPIIGIVSMDQASVDVSDFEKIEVGDEAIIVGSDGAEAISLEDYCNALKSSPAQVLTAITKRVARFYKTLY